MALRSNPGRKRRQADTSSTCSSPPTKRDAGDYYDDDSDEENGKGRKSQDQMYDGACSLGRFCLNPFLCLATTVKMICCRPRARRRLAPACSQPHQKRRFVKCFVLFFIVCAFILWPRHRRRHHPLRHTSDSSLERMPILIKLFDFSNVNDIGGWHYHGSQRFHSISPLLERPMLADTGGLLVPSFRYAPTFRRSIAPDNDITYEHYKKKLVLEMDEVYLRTHYDHPEETLSQKCRQANFASLYFPTCNAFHEYDLSRDYDPHLIHSDAELSYFDSYLFAHGYYRDAWMLKHTETNASDGGGVLKTLRITHPFSIKEFYQVQKDALVMERLQSSPRILEMYGHCSMSILVEPMPYPVEEYIIPDSGMARQSDLDKLDSVPTMNKFSVTEKLEMALEMAESLADLHGYQGGVIVHNDVQPCQWLRNSDNKLIFGDFNRAEVMAFSDEEQQYCKYRNGIVYGNYRSPEEMRDDPVDEQIDVYSLGNNIYGLLTGLWVFYENDDDKVVQDKVKKGQRAYVDDRYRNHSYGEGKLVEFMKQCWIEDPRERIDIFEAVRFLRKAVEEDKKLNDK